MSFDLPARPDDIVALVAQRSGFTPEDLLGVRREKPLSHYRHLAMAACRFGAGLSYPALGRFFHRDHTTILYAVRKISRDERARNLALDLAEEARRSRVA